MADIDWTRIHDDVVKNIEASFAELRRLADDFNDVLNENVMTFCKEIAKITEEKEERKMNIELTERQLNMIIDGLLTHSKSIYNDLHALGAMKGTRLEFDDIDEEIAKVQKELTDVRELCTHLVNITTERTKKKNDEQ